MSPDEPDVDPVVLKGGVDMGLVLTREDGTTYKLYWAESNLCERGLCRRPEDLGDYCVDESLAGSDRPMRVLRLEIKR